MNSILLTFEQPSTAVWPKLKAAIGRAVKAVDASARVEFLDAEAVSRLPLRVKIDAASARLEPVVAAVRKVEGVNKLAPIFPGKPTRATLYTK